MITLLLSYLLSPLVMFVTYFFSRIFFEKRTDRWNHQSAFLVCLFTLAPWVYFCHLKKDNLLEIWDAVFALNLLIFTYLELARPKVAKAKDQEDDMQKPDQSIWFR